MESLFGVPVYVDEERSYTSNHRLILSAKQDGVWRHQCLDCGMWADGDRSTLAAVACEPDDTAEPREVTT